MPRKPNYKFERFERDRAKAIKKAARLQAKVDRRTPDATEAAPIEGGEAVASEETAETTPGTD